MSLGHRYHDLRVYHNLKFELTSFDIIFKKYVGTLELSKESARRTYLDETIDGYRPLGIIKYGIMSEWWAVIYERSK